MILRLIAFAAAAALFPLAVPLPAMAAAAATATSMAAHVTVGDLEISGTFARATLPGARSGGAYITITNKGTSADTLVSAASPTAGSISLHSSTMEGSVMKMTDLAHGIDIPAGQTVAMAPNGLHMMFEHLKTPFVEGKTVRVTLTFAKAGAVDIDIPVLGIAAAAPAHDMEM
jgi:copper(I)-binding protein